MGCKQPNYKGKNVPNNIKKPNDKNDIIVDEKYIFQIHLPDVKEKSLDKKFKEFEKEELKKLFINYEKIMKTQFSKIIILNFKV